MLTNTVISLYSFIKFNSQKSDLILYLWKIITIKQFIISCILLSIQTMHDI